MKRLLLLAFLATSFSSYGGLVIQNLKYSVANKIFGVAYDQDTKENVLFELNSRTGKLKREIVRLKLDTYSGFEINPLGTKAMLYFVTLTQGHPQYDGNYKIIQVDLITKRTKYLTPSLN